MKRKNFRTGLASLVVFLLVAVMGGGAAFTAFTGTENSIAPNLSANSAVQASGSNVNFDSVVNHDLELGYTRTASKTDKIGMIVEMNDTSLIDMYLADPSGYPTFADYRMSEEGKLAAEILKNKQNALFNKIARQADVKLKYNYVSVMNGFAIEITYGDRALVDKIAARSNVLGTTLSKHYDAPEPQAVENQVSADANTGIFDSTESQDEGFGGQGIVVGVLDTGLDWEHIAFDPHHELFKLEEQIEKDTLRFTEDDIAEFIPELTAKKLFVNDLTVTDVYRNEKVPYVFDYADANPEVSTHLENEHGTHVAGIIAGHSDDPFRSIKEGETKGKVYLKARQANSEGKWYYHMVDGEREYVDLTDADVEVIKDKDDKDIIGITGVAPQAQLAILKVFGDYNIGAESIYLLAALEDSITLGLDVVNMSLGAENGFAEDAGSRDSVYEAYDKMGKVGISLIVAASNAYSSGTNSHYGLNLTSNPDSGTICTPGSYESAFTVASISGKKSKYITAVNASGTEFGVAYYTDSVKMNNKYRDFMKEIYDAVKARPELLSKYQDADTGALKIPYATIPGVGKSSDYAGINVTDKIALVARGTTNFDDKIKEAARKGAIACIVYNNAAGVISMQVEDDVPIPSCSITMDESFNIRYKDTAGDAYFVIDDNEEKQAGPFMSEFSSWGPLPNLLLKPEITAHGGEIYSAVPGDETAYARISGTSMACPNMAGVVAIMRQYMQNPENDYAIARKYGVMNTKGDAIDPNLMERRIYQLLMSSATIAHNEQDNPYSPRKQGAGLADLETARKSDQYLYVMKDGKETERTKLELFDDPKREGVYKMEFYVRNVGQNPVEYSVDAYVMTEGISSDKKTVNEKSRMLTAADQIKTFKVNDEVQADNKVTVPAGESVKLGYEITLGAEDKAWLENFVNGMYVEGFVCLTCTSDNGTDLNIPYLAFYGDWEDAPILDYDIYETTADENDDGIKEDDKRYANNMALTLVGKLMQDGTEYSFGMGRYTFNIPKDDYGEDIFDMPDAEEDKCALSYNSDSGLCGLYAVGGFLRGAKLLFWRITDTTTGAVVKEDLYKAARKSSTSNIGGAWIELDLNERDFNLINNHKYNFELYPVIDWKSERFIVYKTGTETVDVGASIQKVIDYNEEYNATKPEELKRRYTWSSDFWIDTDAPFISDAKIRVIRDNQDNASYYLDLYVTDNHYVQAIGLNVFSKDKRKFVSLFGTAADVDDTVRPVLTARNATTYLTYNITDWWSQIKDGLLYRMNNDERVVNENPELGTYLTRFQVTLFDYAFNSSYYNIDVMSLMPRVTELEFGDIGNYKTFTNKQDSSQPSIDVMTSYNKTIAKDNNGNNRTMSEITIIPGQRVELMRSIISDPADAWREDYVFSSSPETVVRVDQESGEIYAVGPGEATVTLLSKTSSASTTLKVKVLNDDQISTYGVTGIKLGEQRLNGLEFKGRSYKKFNAGERYLVEIEHQPWYIEFDPQKYFIRWETSNSTLAWTEKYDNAQDKDAVFKRWIVANDSSYDSDGKYVENSNTDDLQNTIKITATLCEWNENGNNVDPETKNHYTTTFYTATFELEVYEEFVVSGGELKEYHGTPKDGKVTIPDSLDITSIASNLFYKRDDITCIEFPEGLEKIGWAACAYMPNLEEVIFPSTIQTIDGYAFAAHFTANAAGPNTKLSIVDMTRCARPIQVCAYAFAQQRYIGLDMKQTQIIDPAETCLTDGTKNHIVPLSGDKATKFDTKMVRYAGDYAFYGMEYVQHLDLTNLRSTGVASFYKLGASLHKYCETDDGQPLYTSITFGPATTFGIAAFGSSGIGEIEVPMSRITSQAFYGATSDDLNNVSGEVERPDKDKDDEESGDDSGTTEEEEEIPDGLYFGELKKIKFTGDNLVIGSLAFAFSSVEEVEFDCDVDYIGESAFVYSKLNKVTFKGKCRSIGANAFYNTQLTEITMPEGLENIGSAAFAFCSKLTTVKAKADCEALKPADVNDETASFHGCDMLEKFEITGEGYLSSENGILYGDGGNILLAVPCDKDISKASDALGNATKIGTYAFAGNLHLTEVDLGESEVTDIGMGAFSLCKNLISASLPASIKKINDTMFYDSDKLATLDLSKATALTEIGATAFYNTALTEFEVPTSVTKLGVGAFAECKELATVKLHNSITDIPEAIFFNCKKLETITSRKSDGTETGLGELPAVRSVGTQAFTFTGISSIRMVMCETIGNSAFAACEKLTTVELPKVTTIGDYAFFAESEADEDDNLISKGAITELSIPEVIDIGAFAFSAQDKFARANILHCKTVGESAFFSCYGLNELRLYEIEEIGANAFANTSVTLVGCTFTKDFRYMHPSAFVNSKVVEYAIADDNPNYFVYGGALYRDVEEGEDGEARYELVSVPTSWQSDMTFDVREGTVRISDYAFAFSEYLVKVNIPDSVRTIGDSAFYSSSIKVYNFDMLTAPELETTYGYIDTTYDKYFWQIYNNFYMPFNFPYDKFGGAYKYLSIRQTTEDDVILGITENVPLQNFYYTEADSDLYAFSGAWYGIILCRPANATGFDDSNFVWKHYFDDVMLMPELLEQGTQNIMDLISALPAVDQISESDSVSVRRARAMYDTITSYQQRAFVVNAGLLDVLEACEEKLASLTAAEQNKVTAVADLIAKLPAPEEVTLDDENAIAEARVAYEALSAENKTLFDSEQSLALDRLVRCETKIQQLKDAESKKNESGSGCGSCGTVAFGSGSGGGTGLMIGLGCVLLVALLVTLLRKKKVQGK